MQRKMSSDTSGPQCRWRFIWTHVKSNARKVQASTILVLSAIYLPLLQEIK